MLPKAHLTSHSKMSGSRWVITPSWLSGSWRSFLYSFSVYSCHFFLISSASVKSIPFLSFIACHQNKTQFPLSQSLPSGSFHKPLILSHQRTNRIKTTKTKQTDHVHGPQPCLTQWNFEPCRVGPPKMDGLWWRVLTEHDPVAEGMANHFSILALRTPWTARKGHCNWILPLGLSSALGSDIWFLILVLILAWPLGSLLVSSCLNDFYSLCSPSRLPASVFGMACSLNAQSWYC